MIASTRHQDCVNVDVTISRRRSRQRFFFSHVFCFRSSASLSSFSLNLSASSKVDSKQIVETSTTLVMQQRIKDVHQMNMKRELKQKLQRLEAQSTALNQSRNNSVIEDIISQTSDTIFSSDSCI